MGIQNTHFLNAMIYSICVLKSVPLIDTWGGYPHFRQQIHLILVIDHHGIFSNIAKSTGQWTVVIHIPTSSLNVCTASWKTIKKKKKTKQTHLCRVLRLETRTQQSLSSTPKCHLFSSAQLCGLKLNWDWSSEISILICEMGMKEMKALVAQSCPTLCDPTDCSLPGSSVHGIPQARILEWVVICSPGIFLTQGSNHGLLHCRWILLPLSRQGSLKQGECLLIY